MQRRTNVRLFYDDNGNRIAYIASGDTVRGVYDEQDRMLAYYKTIYQYNTQGSLTTKIEGQDTTRYNYDLMGNLLAVSLPNDDEVEYLIDAQNRRVGKILNGVVIKKWIYQDQLNPIAELDGNDSLLSRFIYGSKAHVPDYVVKSNTTYQVITNHLGSVRAVMNVATGEVVQEISYNEFGVVLYNLNPSFQPFAYAGGLYDAQTGLVRFGVRDYDSFTGRWTAKDPIGFRSGDLNPYFYINNSPLNYIDISGLAQITNNSNVSVDVVAYQNNNHSEQYVRLEPGETTPEGYDWDFYKHGDGADWIKCSFDCEIDEDGNPTTVNPLLRLGTEVAAICNDDWDNRPRQANRSENGESNAVKNRVLDLGPPKPAKCF